MILVITNSVFPVAEEITQLLDQVKIKLISQLINGISRLLNYLSILIVLLFYCFPVILILNSNDLEFTIWSDGLSL